jgi:histone deacetylase 1/2
MSEAAEEQAAADDKAQAKEEGQSERDTENVKGEVRAEFAKEES